MQNKIIPVECYSRVSGFYRPVQQYNKGKKSEFEDRVYVKVPESVKSYPSLSL